MSTPCQTATPNPQKLDPSKRVNYTFGLVLGVEEFVQSDTYFLAKHHLENRLLHGYGTVCGLDVVVQAGPVLEIQVTPGIALSPRGQEIRVPQLMCVQVNDWVQANLAQLKSLMPGPAPAVLNLCVVLCYRECKADVVPIPGEPCRTASGSMAASRIADSFDLMLCLDQQASPPQASPPAGASTQGGLCQQRPQQLEDDAIRALAALLAQFEISASGPFLTVGGAEELVRGLGSSSGSVPAGSPPSGPPYLISAADAPELLRAAYRTWITEIRPLINAPLGTGPCCPPPEKCVLLAELAVSINPGWVVTQVTVDDSRRPFLLPTRLLQEALFFPSAVPSATSCKIIAAGYFALDGAAIGPAFNLTATPASPPNGEMLLTFPGYQQPGGALNINYIVKGTVEEVSPGSNGPRATFQFVDFEPNAIRVRILDTTLNPLPSVRTFMAEITQIGGAQ